MDILTSRNLNSFENDQESINGATNIASQWRESTLHTWKMANTQIGDRDLANFGLLVVLGKPPVNNIGGNKPPAYKIVRVLNLKLDKAIDIIHHLSFCL